VAYSVKSKKTGKTYYLHTREVNLLSGRKQRIFYFSSNPSGPGALDQLPPGYELFESPLTGLPMLRKKK
jgi:hypothetical protein